MERYNIIHFSLSTPPMYWGVTYEYFMLVVIFWAVAQLPFTIGLFGLYGALGTSLVAISAWYYGYRQSKTDPCWFSVLIGVFLFRRNTILKRKVKYVA